MSACVVCKTSIERGIAVGNSASSIDFKYLDFEQRAHLECYIDLCVKESTKKTKEKTAQDLNE
jgi:hypothetical protein